SCRRCRYWRGQRPARRWLLWGRRGAGLRRGHAESLRRQLCAVHVRERKQPAVPSVQPLSVRTLRSLRLLLTTPPRRRRPAPRAGQRRPRGLPPPQPKGARRRPWTISSLGTSKTAPSIRARHLLASNRPLGAKGYSPLDFRNASIASRLPVASG